MEGERSELPLREETYVPPESHKASEPKASHLMAEGVRHAGSKEGRGPRDARPKGASLMAEKQRRLGATQMASWSQDGFWDGQPTCTS